MALTEAALKQAEARMQKRRDAGPRAVSAHYDRRVGRVVVQLNTGVELGFPPSLAEGLAQARPKDLVDIEVSPAGTGLHFPLLDVDLYVPALLEGILGSRKWMAQAMGKAGGAQTSEAKAQAARSNGKLGGRPRKRVES
ncbi:DUF2442 domain-containing protein [Variovorax ginsengisoli]|jgi:hypothetical protein|uniref:DUF2442 domain-containing protein n=1 Tax=Variovorax ginsengisoli TaxID=363844 RepID=A0ABT8S4A2_9BURK|nr:DUF2442 domain-containing protein [Variovorax ginsengisoli]MDN8614556.1 DUF2442 domain-containing protein [Variovorax ginsengisoli]MDO1533726.1 DUF2442 domain-containing protein [Variovorax ginsengisoli]